MDIIVRHDYLARDSSTFAASKPFRSSLHYSRSVLVRDPFRPFAGPDKRQSFLVNKPLPTSLERRYPPEPPSQHGRCSFAGFSSGDIVSKRGRSTEDPRPKNPHQNAMHRPRSESLEKGFNRTNRHRRTGVYEHPVTNPIAIKTRKSEPYDQLVMFRFSDPSSACKIPRASIRVRRNSSSKSERASCSSSHNRPRLGACGSLNKSSSLEGPTGLLPNRHPQQIQNGMHNNAFRRPQAISQSSGLGNGRHNSNRAVAVDDCGSRADRWRRNGATTNSQAYELSQDLADKRLEMLERRYGGDRARRAAVVIQRAYRSYAMHKKFRAITATAKAQEKRLSRRFTIESSEWGPDALKSLQDAEKNMRTELDQLNRDINCTAYVDNPSRSASMRATNCTPEVDYLNDSSLYCHSEHLLSPGATADHSGLMDANSYASSKDIKFLVSEDSGFGSQDTISSKASQNSKNRHSKISIGKKIPPDIPRRSSSIKSSESSGSVDSFAVYSSANHRVLRAPPSLTPPPSTPSSVTSDAGSDKNSLRRSADNGSLSSVQSSGSDSSLSQSASERGTDETNAPTSPIWKRKAQGSDVYRKRQYRVGLNLFNKKPEKGISYLISKGFFEDSPQAVAKFLITRKGLSKQMIGEYLGNLQSSFCMTTLEFFSLDIDLYGMHVDVALRKFQAHFRMPGEAQKIERLMQVFAQRYCQCNGDIAAKLRDNDTVFVLAFAIIMLNTDQHTPAIKNERRMKLEEFIRNLRGVDEGCDIERDMLVGMYNRIKAQEFKPGHDHVTQVLKVQQTVVGKKPVLALPHRRLVCYCRLYEITDVNKKERPGIHQREVFLFNDLLVVTKIMKRNKNTATYTFRESYPLAGLSITVKESAVYQYILEIKQRVDNKILIIFNARNEHDKTKFCDDLKESILEMDEMENLRIEGELERQKANMRASRPASTAENRDSGVADMDSMATDKNFALKPEGTLRKTALSNSLLDIHEAGL